MAQIDSASQAQAEALGLAARKANQGLEPYTDGTASPGGRIGPYLPDVVDQYVEALLGAATDAGYAPVLPEDEAVATDGQVVTVTGTPPGSVTLQVQDGAVQSAALPPSQRIVVHQDAVNIIGPSPATTPLASATIAIGTAGNLVGVRLGVTSQAILANSATVPLLPSTGTTPAQGSATAAVSANSLTGVRLAATLCTVQNGATFSLRGQTLTAAVAANAVTFSLPATAAVLANGGTVPVQSAEVTQAGTVTVAAGEVTGVALPGSAGIVLDGAPVDISTSTDSAAGTAAVLDGEVGVVLPADIALAADGTVLPVTGGTVTLSVADGVLSAEYTPE